MAKINNFFIGVVFARGNSKGIKNKNLLKFKNLTLVEHSVKQGYQTKLLKKVYISSDSKKIINNAKKQKAIVPFIRPKLLSTDTSPEILSWRHFIKYLYKNDIRPKYIVSIPTTSPLRKVSDITKSMLLAKKKKYDIVFTLTKSSKNPYFNMVILKNKKIQLLKNKKKLFRRQEGPEFFDICTICYIFKPEYILKTKNLFSGKVGFVNIPKKRSVDIDDELDYKFVNFLLNEKK